MSNILDIRSQLKRNVPYIGHQKSTKQKSKFQGISLSGKKDTKCSWNDSVHICEQQIYCE